VSGVELAIAAVFVLLGLRSLWKWSRRPLEAGGVIDHLLFALFATGRVGLWFALAGVFVLYALTTVEGRLTSEFDRFRWALVVPIVLAALQLLAAYALGRRSAG
jgi:hypothetical protein